MGPTVQTWWIWTFRHGGSASRGYWSAQIYTPKWEAWTQAFLLMLLYLGWSISPHPYQLLEEFRWRACYRSRVITREICSEYGLVWWWGTRRGQNSFCVQLSLQGPTNVCLPNIRFSFSMSIAFLFSKVPNSYSQHLLLLSSEDGIYGKDLGHFHELLNSLGCLPCIHVIKLFWFSPVNRSHANLILMPARRT